MATVISPMSLGDIFDRLFKLIGRTALRNLLLAGIILLPASALMTFGMKHFFSSVAHLSQAVETSTEVAPERILNMLGSLLIYGVTLAVFILATLAATMAVTMVGCAEISAQPLDWRTALDQTFSVRLLRLCGQVVLEYAALAALFVVPYVLLVVGLAQESVGLSATSGLLLFAATLAAVYLWIRWAFALPAIAWEDAGVLQSFRRSWFLVKGWWWRTFGILLLLNLVVQFAISIVTTPISLAAMWGFYVKYFEMFGSLSQGEANPEMGVELLQSIGIGLGVVIFISSLLSLMVTPLITAVMYFDLRARKHEFVEPAATTTE